MDALKAAAAKTASAVKHAAKDTYHSGAVQASKLQLSHDISNIDSKIRKRKRQFGEEVYDALCNEFTAEVNRLLEVTKKDIAAMHNDKTRKKQELENLKHDKDKDKAEK
uniref:Uncharacterized protein n=1 Tax=Pyramimonas obovata TaxID=1411642 RepID=A0A7S0RXB8_9CHLO|mmetsp:Transcript_8752/g.18146  ORF Transcript_8752/g.18146 Transcript_8752/m.18146 type:complete len:109 (+) Transcript_8752:88-414(+)